MVAFLVVTSLVFFCMWLAQRIAYLSECADVVKLSDHIRWLEGQNATLRTEGARMAAEMASDEYRERYRKSHGQINDASGSTRVDGDLARVVPNSEGDVARSESVVAVREGTKTGTEAAKIVPFK